MIEGVRIWHGRREVPLGGKWDDPRAHLAPGIMHAQMVNQQLGCSNCSRVRQWRTWTIRCMGCVREAWVAEGCEDCGIRPEDRMLALRGGDVEPVLIWERYNEHVRRVHGDYMVGNFSILEEMVPELIGKPPEDVGRMWRTWLNSKPQDDIRMLVIRPLNAEDRKLIQLRFFNDFQRGVAHL